MTRHRPTQAVILAGGRGTRLKPLTNTVPKPMVLFHGKPFLGYIVEMLREQGFTHVLMLLGYLASRRIHSMNDFIKVNPGEPLAFVKLLFY